MQALGRQGTVALAAVLGDDLEALAERDHIFEKLKDIFVFFLARPVEP